MRKQIIDKIFFKAKSRLLKLHYESKSGHLGGNLSSIDCLLTLYHMILNENDLFVLSKGHSACALYISLWSKGLISEKTLKTCAFKHPCIIWGHAGTLAWQRRQGFETFEHCIDEGYDSVLDEEVRLDGVIEQIHLCISDKTIFTDPLTKQKLEHNYNHFYNQEIIMKLMHEQIIDPLLEFINA